MSDTQQRCEQDALLRSAVAELTDLAGEPLRLTRIDARLGRLLELEEVLEHSAEQYPTMSRQVRQTYDRLVNAWHDERDRLRTSHEAPEVIAEAWAELETQWVAMHAGATPLTDLVLCVLRGEPDWELGEIVLPYVTLAPRGRQCWEWSLVRCPRWFYELLESTIRSSTPDGTSSRYLSDPVGSVTDTEIDFVSAIWEDEPTATFFTLDAALEAARSLG
jgi:hypothetical protein